MIIDGLTINESEFLLENGNCGKIVVFLYSGSSDPYRHLNLAVEQYTKDSKTHFIELISSKLDNPWMRVIVSNPNDMFQENFDTEKHHIDKSLHNKITQLGI